MSEWFDSQKKESSNIHKLLQEQIEKTNPRRELTIEETKRLNKLEGITGKLRRGENVQNRQLHRLGLEELLLAPNGDSKLSVFTWLCTLLSLLIFKRLIQSY